MKNREITLDDVVNKDKNGDYTVPEITSRYWPREYIVNEDLSVKENRRLVQEHNKEVDDARTEHMKQISAKMAERREDLIYGVMNYSSSGINEEQASKIVDFATENFSNDTIDNYVIDLYSLIDLIDSIVDTK